MALAPSINGIKTIKWGTDGTLSGALVAAIVESASFKPLVERAKIPGNIGSTKATVLVDDGWEATLKCVYQTDLSWPQMGDIILVAHPLIGGGSKKAEVIDVSLTRERKKEAMIEFKLEHFNDLTY